ncbi:streptomycin biosynthesis protein StrI [Planctomycetales bacterium]|nr:streptomycin biosynthesis protein StrI [Planctomycetales bacterium]
MTSPAPVHAAENNTINIGVIGCGGRGLGAVNQALTTGNVKLVAIGDAFEEKASNAANALKRNKSFEGKIADDVAIFSGLDNYKKVMDALNPGDVVLLTTPPAFRPLHFEYAVNRGLHIFAEKPLAVDTPGCKRLLAANKLAQEKNLKIAVGLMMRHHFRTEETIAKIHDGSIGDIVACYVYRMHSEYRPAKPPADSPAAKSLLQSQIIGFQGFPWGNGGFYTDWMIHSVDVACWARKEMLPVSVEGQGGRQVIEQQNQLFDHAAYEYRFDDGVKMIVQLKHISNTFYQSGDWIFGTKGAARIGETISEPKIYKGYKEDRKNLLWKSEAANNNHYQEEHNRFFAAIRNDKPWNEMQRSVDATLTCLMARMSVDSGQELSREKAWDSTHEMAPGLDNWTFNSEAPVKPNADGTYALAKPGTTKEY